MKKPNEDLSLAKRYVENWERYKEAMDDAPYKAMELTAYTVGAAFIIVIVIILLLHRFG